MIAPPVAEVADPGPRSTTAATEGWRDIGTLEDVPRLGARVVKTARGAIAVFRSDDDSVFALDDKCPHRGGPLSQGIVHGRRVTCPLHNFVIELSSGEAVAPDEGCVHRHEIRVEGGRLLLRVEGGAASVA